MRSHWRSPSVALVILALALSTSPAVAAGGGGGGGAGGGGGEGTADSVRINADPDLKAGMEAVKAQQWDKAIARLNAYVARKPRDADAWNELAHAYRKSGDLDNAFKGYDKALQIDPKHRNAHEYLGEAYLQAGDLIRAEAQLRSLDKLCLLPCEQYTDLKEEIRRYKADHPVASR
jgi:cytochrome c-type biogenesis protein CcmH/NrfG